eukprot:Platyproteum_vivax@DN6735_c0_g2_i3.p1
MKFIFGLLLFVFVLTVSSQQIPPHGALRGQIADVQPHDFEQVNEQHLKQVKEDSQRLKNKYEGEWEKRPDLAQQKAAREKFWRDIAHDKANRENNRLDIAHEKANSENNRLELAKKEG